MAVTNAGSSPLTFTNLPVGIQVTKITDTSADWASVSNSTYFYDKADGLVHYKNSSGVVLELFSAGGLTYFTEAEATSSPNNTVYVDSLTAAASSTNADAVIRPKGNGAFILAIPDNTTTGGNKRGQYAVDLCLGDRGNPNQVASGNYSAVIGGRYVKAAGTASFATGDSCSANGPYSFAAGQSNTINGNFSIGIGGSNSTAQDFNIAMGTSNTCTVEYYAYALGHANAASNRANAFGYANTSSGLYSHSFGKSNTASGADSTALGSNNVSSASGATSLGVSNTANGSYSNAQGYQSHVFGIYGRQSYASGQESTAGDSQASKFVLHERTTDATATTLTTNSSAASTTNQVILSNQSAYRFKGTIIGKKSGTTDIAAWDVDGLIVRGANAAATTLVVGNVNLVSNAPVWGTPTLAADTTNGGLQVQVTGFLATNIQWTATIETTEVIYA